MLIVEYAERPHHNDNNQDDDDATKIIIAVVLPISSIILVGMIGVCCYCSHNQEGLNQPLIS